MDKKEIHVQKWFLLIYPPTLHGGFCYLHARYSSLMCNKKQCLFSFDWRMPSCPDRYFIRPPAIFFFSSVPCHLPIPHGIFCQLSIVRTWSRALLCWAASLPSESPVHLFMMVTFVCTARLDFLSTLFNSSVDGDSFTASPLGLRLLPYIFPSFGWCRPILCVGVCVLWVSILMKAQQCLRRCGIYLSTETDHNIALIPPVLKLVPLLHK